MGELNTKWRGCWVPVSLNRFVDYMFCCVKLLPMTQLHGAVYYMACLISPISLGIILQLLQQHTCYIYIMLKARISIWVQSEMCSDETVTTPISDVTGSWSAPVNHYSKVRS